jgi:hypothetical protein
LKENNDHSMGVLILCLPTSKQISLGRHTCP